MHEDIKEPNSHKRLLTVYANDMSPNELDKIRERQLLTAGLANFLNGNTKAALPLFKQALESYGSPLGYLYAGVLDNNDDTFERYYTIATLAVEGNALQKDVFDEHVHYLIQEGFLSKS